MRSPILTLLALATTGLLAQHAAPRPAKEEPAAGRAPVEHGNARAGGDAPTSPGAVRVLAAAAHAPGFARQDRPLNVPRPLSIRVLPPRATPRCQAWPDSAYWQNRDLGREIQFMARRGFIPVTPGGNDPVLTGATWYPAGWRAYAFVVPAKEKLHVRLHHPNEGWFRLAMVDRWGQLREGMLQNVIPTGNPEVSFTNPQAAATTVYVIVDDPGWMSTDKNPFTLNVDRSWDPVKVETPALPPVLGIWAQAKPAGEEPDKQAAAPPA